MKYFFSILVGISLTVTHVMAAENWVKYTNKGLGVETELGRDWAIDETNPCRAEYAGCTVAIALLPAATGEKGSITITQIALQGSTTFKQVKDQIADPALEKTNVTIGGRQGFKIATRNMGFNQIRECYYIDGGKIFWAIDFVAPVKVWKELKPIFEHVRNSMRFQGK
jgi:hypothetical protein